MGETSGNENDCAAAAIFFYSCYCRRDIGDVSLLNIFSAVYTGKKNFWKFNNKCTNEGEKIENFYN